jgi:hypothetical protein
MSRMNPLQIEAWALDVIEHVERGQAYEDSRVELKREWPSDAVKAARQIAAHANAARGASILWLVGVDEKSGVAGVNLPDLATWWPQVVSAFDGSVAPGLRDVIVTKGGIAIVALYMETDRAPYVVRVPGGQQISHEVPWRDGARTRSASRSDLIRILVPLQSVPTIDVLGGSMQVNGPDAQGMREVHARIALYFTPLSSTRIVIPRHTCEFVARVVDQSDEVLTMHVEDFARDRDCLTINVSNSQAVLDGPAMLALCARTQIPHNPQLRLPAEVELRASVCPAGADRKLPVSVRLKTMPSKDGNIAYWG